MAIEKMVPLNESLWLRWRDAMSMHWPPDSLNAVLTSTHAVRPIVKATSSRVRADRKRLK